MTPPLLVLIILGGAIGAWFIFWRACRDHERVAGELEARQRDALDEDWKAFVECERIYEEQVAQLARAQEELRRAKEAECS